MISTCQQCGNERPILARGLCSRCYGGLWRMGKLDRYPATTKRGRPPFRQPPPRYINWHAIADDRRREIGRLRARIAELEAACTTLNTSES